MASSSTRTDKSFKEARCVHGKATEILRNPGESKDGSNQSGSTSASRAAYSGRKAVPAGAVGNGKRAAVTKSTAKLSSKDPTKGYVASQPSKKTSPDNTSSAAEFKSPADEMPLPDGFKKSEFSGKEYKASESSIDAISTEEIVRELNKVRRRYDLNPVRQNELLNSSAQAKAEDMSRHSYFAHENPFGKKPHDFVNESAYQYVKIAENILVSTNTSENGCIASWMNSPHHRDNMLHGKFTEVGIGVTQGTYKGRLSWMLVQHFGTPQPAVPLPNEKDKTKLQELKGVMNQVKEDMDRKKRQLSTGGKSTQEYNSLVEEVNGLVDRFNTLNKEYRRISDSYNKQVREYNRRIRESI
eukprot:gb/GECG01012927.1/.p1 GENE.gb/GECG01012927.1/~~gb/GECG01012927.1/.p1  ORF type:complete len:356 (+),score=50.28 gb/GECG01012927.1/:1-1068(+)